MPQIYLDLPGELQQALPAPLDQVARRNGIRIPESMTLTQGPIPAVPGEPTDKDWGTLITIATPEHISLAAQAITGLLGVVGEFAASLSRRPRLTWQVEEVELSMPDGTVMRRSSSTPVLLEPGPQLQAEIEIRLQRGTGFLLRAKIER